MQDVKKFQEVNLDKFKIKGKFSILQFMLMIGSIAMIATALLRHWLA